MGLVKIPPAPRAPTWIAAAVLVGLCSLSLTGPIAGATSRPRVVRLRLPNVGTIQLSGWIAVSVKDFAGDPVTDPRLAVQLQIRTGIHRWLDVGKGAPKHGRAVIGYELSPRSTGVIMRAHVQGAGNVTTSSAPQHFALVARQGRYRYKFCKKHRGRRC